MNLLRAGVKSKKLSIDNTHELKMIDVRNIEDHFHLVVAGLGHELCQQELLLKRVRAHGHRVPGR